jgi:hypothetical protein
MKGKKNLEKYSGKFLECVRAAIVAASSLASSGTVPVPVGGCKSNRRSVCEAPPALAAETDALHLMSAPFFPHSFVDSISPSVMVPAAFGGILPI